MLSAGDFSAFHSEVHGRPPFSWQQRLVEQVVDKQRWPDTLDLPTGSGKTTCIDIALFALAMNAESPADKLWCPRRIAMVVDRRVVVDQVAERGRTLAHALANAGSGPAVRKVADALRSLSRTKDDPLAVFTLRGGMPKDDGWARTPDQPLILASTVDQIGSRLLVQGYGVSKGMKPVHAGLLGNDLLLLLDEVHLSQPFAEFLNGLRDLRQKFDRLPRRFAFAKLSATPGETKDEIFSLLDDEKASDSPLGPRLHASKQAVVREAPSRLELEKLCVDEAIRLSAKHQVVAVVVNRVASATAIAQALKESLRESCDVVPLTGRMRPLDRDDLMQDLLPRVRTGRDRAAATRLIVVGTQCIEAGADFDFDALVTEAASLDALKQRFGRVDRLGLYNRSENVIVVDKTAKADDPIYGEALGKAIKWLGKKADFGVLALPTPENMAELLAPKQHAPVLLPAYLDLWVQSSPAPDVVPDIGLWLHGPKSGPADVQVVWRADVKERDLILAAEDDAALKRLVAIVAAVKPSSLEAISLPFTIARRWLQRLPAGDVADVEGANIENASTDRGNGSALRWDRDDSKIISAVGRYPTDRLVLRPGDTIIVPCERGGIRERCFDESGNKPVFDLAEQGSLFSRGVPTLRLQRDILKQLELPEDLEDMEDSDEIREVLVSRRDALKKGTWRFAWLNSLVGTKRSFAVTSVDAVRSWEVLKGKRILPADLVNLRGAETAEDGVELTTDDEDSFYTGRAVSLAEHSRDVETFAKDYAESAGLPKDVSKDIALAGWLHDIGKADRRFQIMLRGGSKIEFFKDETVLAKSGMDPAEASAHRRARDKSEYPVGARHEVLSLAMLERHADEIRGKATDLDLVLHLVASHHGFCRPFAPVSIDEKPVEVILRNHESKTFGVVNFEPMSSEHNLHRLDSAVADRFWGLVEKYGWLELCWLEAILRLADHRASEKEQEEGDE